MYSISEESRVSFNISIYLKYKHFFSWGNYTEAVCRCKRVFTRDTISCREKFPMLLFLRFQMKWINVVILETFSYVQYFYTPINNNQMQRELFNNKFEELIKCLRPFKRAAVMLVWPAVTMSLTPLR